MEEILEAVWIAEESGTPTRERVRALSHGDWSDSLLAEMVAAGLVELPGDVIRMTDTGRCRSAGLIRRKRLGEVLLDRVLNLKGDKAEAIVCEFEHGVIPEVEKSICVLLGHPTECPHGRRIPPGHCCLNHEVDITQRITCVTDLEIGQKIRIAYVRPSSHDMLHKLLNLGLRPGVVIEIHQKRPTFIVRFEGMEVAMDEEVAAHLHGWRWEP
ncbi:MAG: hypothetical protein A2284_00195 [Deltaproteobacteria bacterium RIFOXYA12_FULL_61_11]|nr:MAG: hypothetical protein A2284_00195 [Deltaproteobacteria bacterium RIFOXYA12_FULL_61_11]